MDGVLDDSWASRTPMILTLPQLICILGRMGAGEENERNKNARDGDRSLQLSEFPLNFEGKDHSSLRMLPLSHYLMEPHDEVYGRR